MKSIVKAPRCTFCKRLVYPWQPVKVFPGSKERLHEQCAADIRKIWKEDMKRGGA